MTVYPGSSYVLTTLWGRRTIPVVIVLVLLAAVTFIFARIRRPRARTTA